MSPLMPKSVYLAIALSATIPSLVVPVAIKSAQAQVTETIIYVDSDSGNDQTATGDRNNPYQSITEAIEAAPNEAVIQLARGTYSEETGETFPIVIEKPLEIRGEAENQGYHTKIVGGGEFYSRTGAGQNVGIAILDNATLTGVTVTNKRDRGVGVWIEDANPTLVKNTFQRNDNTGVAINGTGRATLLNNYFYSNSGNGLVIYGQTQPTIKNNTFERTGFGISIIQNAIPQIIGNEIKSNRIGVLVEGQAQPILRENIIELSTEDGFVAIANSRPDLGTNNEPGENIFRGNQETDIKNLTKDYTIPINGNRITGEIEGSIDRRGIVTAQTPNPPENSNLPPLLANPPRSNSLPEPETNTTTKEQVWTAPNNQPPQGSQRNNSFSLSTNNPLPPLNSLPLIPPEATNNPNITEDSNPITLPPPNPTPSNNTSSNNNPPNVTPQRNRLEEILVLEPNASPRQPASNALPVPSGNIPRGNPFRPGTSPEERAAAVGGDYRVVVEIRNANDKNKVKEIVPQAFTSRYQGRAVMQVGIFRSRANAEEIRQKLGREGLQVRLIPVQ